MQIYNQRIGTRGVIIIRQKNGVRKTLLARAQGVSPDDAGLVRSRFGGRIGQGKIQLLERKRRRIQRIDDRLALFGVASGMKIMRPVRVRPLARQRRQQPQQKDRPSDHRQSGPAPFAFNQNSISALHDGHPSPMCVNHYRHAVSAATKAHRSWFDDGRGLGWPRVARIRPVRGFRSAPPAGTPRISAPN